MRLIDADKLKEDIKENGCDRFETWDKMLTLAEYETFVEDVIDNAPTVGRERPQVNVIPQECIKVLAKTITDVVQQIDWKALCEKVAERPQGEWIEDGYRDLPCVCSYCGEVGNNTKYCPNCGAKMQKGGAE